MGSDTPTTDISSVGHPLLDLARARRLLSAISSDEVVSLHHISNTNDVFRAVTDTGGRYYVKFHTADWYKAAADTYAVVHREQEVWRLLRRRGVTLDYSAWIDCSRRVVGRSVLITSELPGLPLPSAIESYPRERQEVLAALAAYLSELHGLEFPTAGYIEYCGDPEVRALPEVDPGRWWNSHACQSAAGFSRFALGALDSVKPLLPAELLRSMGDFFAGTARELEAEYAHPTFVINNYHPFHVHVRRSDGRWKATGVYDFEAASSGNPAFDLALNDLQITPLVGSTDWRADFYRHYEPPVRFESYKAILIIYVAMELSRGSTTAVPDLPWLVSRFPDLLRATTMAELGWFPGPAARR